MIGYYLQHVGKCDVLCHYKKGFQRISEMHPTYVSLEYPLLFPYREDGWHTLGKQLHWK